MARHARRPVTLAARLTLWYAGIFILFTGSAFLLFYLSINTILDQRIDEDLQEDIAEMRSLYADGGIAGVKTEIRREVAQDNADEIFLRLLDSEGTELFATDMSHWQSLAPDIEVLRVLSITAPPGWKPYTWKVMIFRRGLSRDCLPPA